MKRNPLLVVAISVVIALGLSGGSSGAPVLKVGDQIIFRPLKELYPWIHLCSEEPADAAATDTPTIQFESVGRRIATVKAIKGAERNVIELEIAGLEKYAYLTRVLPLDRDTLLCMALPLEEWRAAQKLPGTAIWRNSDGDFRTDSLPKTRNLEKFYICAVDLAGGNGFDNPLKFTLKSSDGRKADWYGSLRDIDRYWHKKNPRSLHNWNSRIWKLIENEKVCLGMTTTQAVLAWGHPEDINRSTGRWGVHEQWVYGSGCYLYFENGKLDAIDN